jgi:nucleotide-binding universal stress UspA family protein
LTGSSGSSTDALTQPTLGRVVVGVDFAEPSGDAAAWTARHLVPGVELVLVHAVHVPEPPRFLEHAYPPTERLIDLARVGAEQKLRDLSLSLGAPLVWPEIRVGQPDEVIANVAAEYSAGLIVVGPHAERPGGRAGLGSTAERVLWRAACPVLVAKNVGAGPPLHLLAALDGSAITPLVLAWTDFLMARHDSSAVLVHVVDSTPRVENTASEEAPVRDATRWLEEQRRTLTPHERADTAALIGRPAQAILAEAEDRKSDLIVLGNRGAGGVERFLFGSVAATILREAACPVLVIIAEPHVARAGAAHEPGSGVRAVEDKPDRVSEASMASFPASDPPAWMAMRVGSPFTDAERLDGTM